jgi:uncharacterized protein YxjI
MGLFGRKKSNSQSPMVLKAPTDLNAVIVNDSQMVIMQKREMAEIFLGFETRNRYLIFDQNGSPCGTIEEQSFGVMAFLKRMFLKSHRPFTVLISDASAKPVLKLQRKFFFFFSDLEVSVPNGPKIGSIHRRFGILNKKYDLCDPDGRVFARIRSSVFKIWTFAVRDTNDQELARISKKWSGALKEYFSDSDNFMIEFGNCAWTARQRAVLLSAAVTVDFDFFENNNN